MSTPATTRIVVINPNTSTRLTAELERLAQHAADPGVHVHAIQPDHGPSAVEDWRTAYLSATGMIKRIESYHERMDALVIAGFGDVGLHALQEITTVPVIDMTHAGAAASGPTFGIVTTIPQMIDPIRSNLAAAGLLTPCVGIEPISLGIAASTNADIVVPRIMHAIKNLADRGATAICLGSAAFSRHTDQIRELTTLPVVDPLAAALTEATLSRRSRWEAVLK